MSTSEQSEVNSIAIVSVALRVPGAVTPEQFWQNLCHGVESVEQYDEAQLLAAGVSRHELANPHYVRAGAPLPGMELFDPEFFALGPKEGAIMDPQQRQFLETAWEALERAGVVPARFDGSIGVFAGCGQGSYYAQNILRNRELVDSVGTFLLRHTGNDKDFLATRTSYCFDLRGPSVNVQTACSTSLVAVHLACQSLLSGECDLALAGGVTIELPHRQGYVFHEGEVLSPDGHCRAFDARAQGTVFGSGVGVVALRRLQDALDAGERVVAVIKGSAVNNDGSRKVGYLAPSVDGQAAAISEALAIANVPADSIGLCECHGTGTAMGDPIEIAALTQAFTENSTRTGYCAVGSVKTNIGHLDTAAGVVALIKAALALQQAQLPPSLNFERENPEIGFAKTPFYVNTRLQPWAAGKTPRRAAVNSLGVGGTNAYVVLEEAPAIEDGAPGREQPVLISWSARNPRSLLAQQARLAEWIAERPTLSLADIAHTLQHAREHFSERRVLAAASRSQLLALLSDPQSRQVYTHHHRERAQVVFMFPGGGAQYPRMGEGLLAGDAVYREHVERGLELALREHQLPLRELLSCADGDEPRAAAELERPSLQLPLLFIVEHALAQSWLARGVKPSALIGHSMGENTAACVAGVMDFKTTLGLVALRGRLFESLPDGGMLSVPLSAAALRPLLPDGVVIACENAPELSVASGPRAAIARLQAELTQRELDVTPIRIRVAAHSPMLERILEEFGAYLRRAKLSTPQLPIISNLTGQPLTAAEAQDPAYWVRHLRSSVKFEAGIRGLEALGPRVYLEVGPGRALGSLVRQCTKDPKTPTISSLRHPDERVDDALFALAALGRLWASGADVDLADAVPSDGKRVLLPTYAFDHQPYFIPLAAADSSRRSERRDRPEDWFYTQVWSARELGSAELSDAPEQTYLLFADDLGLADALSVQLRAAGHRTVFVRKSGAYGQTDVFEYEVAPGAPHSYETLVQELRASEKLPDRIVHLWGVDAANDDDAASWRYDPARRALSWDSAFHLARALCLEGVDRPIKLTLVTSGAQRVATEPVPSPEKALVRGVQAVLPRELPELRASWVDVTPPRRTRGRLGVRSLQPLDALVSALEREARAAGSGTTAYRDGQRFERELSFTPQPQLPAAEAALRERGVYLITGGLGGLGLRLAEQLARARQARLALVSRRRLPPRESWPQLLRERPASDPLARTLKSLQCIEANGGEVELISADVADLTQMREALARVRTRFGALHGVFHTAGLLDDKLLAHKTSEEAERVLRPKLEGTWVLHQLTQHTDLELLVLFSSTSTVLGPPGQVDYVAANAFVEAYAQAQRAQTGPRCVVVQWGAFRDVGMAADALRAHDAHAPELETAPLSGPFFDLQRTAADGSVRYELTLSAQRWWVNEHRLKDGSALVPGTGYLQLMAAAARAQGVRLPCALRDVAFLRPLFVSEQEPIQVSVRLSPLADGSYACEIESGRSELHASATIAPHFEPAPARLDLAALRARTPRVVEDDAGIVTAQEQHLRFGPRFRSLREARYGEAEALGELRLDQAFARDLEDNALHAGLLDIGTGFAMALIAGYSPEQGLWAPLSYRGLILHRPLPAHCFAWVRTHGPAHAQAASLAFDVQLCDADGQVCVEVSELTLRHIARGQTLSRAEAGSSIAPAANGGGSSAAQQAFARTVAQGLDADEGMQVLTRLLGTGISSCLISPVPPEQLAQSLTDAVSPAASAGTRFARPELSSAFVEPSAGVQRTLADIWSAVLGIENVGAQDDFFELGGHSLTAVRLTNAVRKHFGVELGLGSLFEAPTVERLARLIAPDADTTSPAEPARMVSGFVTRGSRGFTPIVPIKPLGSLRPLFCVAGQGGNPMHLRTLAHYLGADRPFYGLQHRGLDGQSEPYASVEQMAEDFLLHMRELAAGPYLIAGYSGGGTAAFEMARQLRAAGERVDALVLLDSFCPLEAEPSLAWRARAHLSGLRREGLAYAQRRVRSRLRDGKEKLEARLLGRAPVTVQSRSMFETAAANWQSIEARYRPLPLDCEAHLFRVQSQSSDEARYFERRYRAWEKLILRGVRETVVPGTHVSMCEEPNVQTLAEQLRITLADVAADAAAAE